MKGDIGKPFDRVDGRAKVTGQATYAAEVAVKNIAHAIVVGSAIARGRVVSIDIDAAQKRPGVIRILTAQNAPKLRDVVPDPKKGDRVLQLLEDDRVWYAEQPIAVVVADTLEHAQDAATSLVVRYDAATADVALEPNLSRAFDAEDLGPNGQAASARGDVATALTTAAHRIERTYRTQVQTHNPMEPHATIAVWHGDTRLTVYDSTQGIFNVRGALAKRFGLPPENVRVISHFLGGGFGCKGAPWSHVLLCAMAAKAIRRPVKLAITRQQMFAFVGYRPRTIQKVTLATDRAGKLLAISHDAIAECSRFDRFVEPSGLQSRHLYQCDNVTTNHKLVELDIATPTFTRGPGLTSGTFALESAMDELAYEIGIDPLELRRRNHAERDDHEKKPYSAKSLLAAYDQASKRFGWASRPMKPRSLRDGNLLVGWGMASVTYPAKQRPASARALMRADGTLVVQAGTQDIGTGTYTIMSQIAADAMNVPFERVRFELGDTMLPETPLSAGSLTAASTGTAVKQACDKLRALLEALRTSPNQSWADIVAHAGRHEIVAEATANESERKKQHSCHTWGALFVEVKVDPALARVRVSRIVAAYAAGTILNPKTARSQYIGGLIWGIGYALMEHTVRDEHTGRIVTPDLVEYHVPVQADIPDIIDVIQVPEEDLNMNELGVKGIGEIGMSGSAAAIANAVFHATGKRIRELPITVEKLL